MWAAGYERRLLIIGRPGWMEGEIVTFIQSSPFYNSKLFWFSGIDDHDLALVYARSHALVFSSIAEGFGLPMIEAGMARKPVLVLDTSIAREIIGEYGLYFQQASGLISELVRLEDPNEYFSACERMNGYDWPTWAQLAPQLFDRLVEASTAAITGRESRASNTLQSVD